jgi:(p)ppGpp synthase/HD superfamily hydrolase
MTDFYPELVMRSLELAARWHEGQKRKHPFELIPYIAHPAGVGFLLQKAGYSDEIVAAGILHDVIEDCGVTEEDLVKTMNSRIAKLVQEVSEPDIHDWRQKKIAFIEKLSRATDEALAIKAADHLHNLQSILSAARASSSTIWNLFGADRDSKLAYEQSIVDLVANRLKPSPLVEAHRAALEEVRKLPLD